MASAAAEAASPRPRRRRWARTALRGLGRVLLAIGVLLLAALANAHPMPETRAWVDTRPDGLQLTLQLPLNRLEYAFGEPLADSASTVLARHGDRLSAYLLQHVGARSGADGGGPGWQVLAPTLRVNGNDASAELEAVLQLRAPPGIDPRQLSLLLDPVIHEVRTHRIQVLLRNDWASGRASQSPDVLGTLDSAHRQLPLSLAPVAPGAAWLSLVHAGAQHIAEGTDHLIFLFMLLLAAPMIASTPSAAGEGTDSRVPPGWRSSLQWRDVRPWRNGLLHIAGVVTAFTVGHSLTLALGSSGWVQVPSAPVEIAVAATIAIAAIHALRPLWADAETPMAAGFGLIHGLAFSASLDGAGLTPWQHAQALLAFNLGIEAMQLLLIATVLPPLMLIARSSARSFSRLRQLCASASLVLAALWLAQRCGWEAIDDRLNGWEASVHPLLGGLAALWVWAAICTWRHERLGNQIA